MNVQEESILSVYAHLGGEGEVVYTQKGECVFQSINKAKSIY